MVSFTDFEWLRADNGGSTLFSFSLNGVPFKGFVFLDQKGREWNPTTDISYVEVFPLQPVNNRIHKSTIPLTLTHLQHGWYTVTLGRVLWSPAPGSAGHPRSGTSLVDSEIPEAFGWEPYNALITESEFIAALRDILGGVAWKATVPTSRIDVEKVSTILEEESLSDWLKRHWSNLSGLGV